MIPLPRTRLAIPFVLAAAAAVGACHSTAPKPEQAPGVAEAAAGAIWIARSGCGSCHQIPGIEHANGMVGPPLIHWAQRTIVAGYLPNTRANLTRWIQHPQAVAPGNAMPEAGLTQKQASDIAAYLLSLK